jgi:hypothetical protein
MKTSILLVSLLIPSITLAKSVSFTSLGSNSGNVFAGVKVEEKGSEPETYMIHVNKELHSKKFNLPEELIHREVIAILPTSSQDIVVITQRTIEQGDKPQFHSLSPSSGKWTRLAKSDCISFSKMKVSNESVALRCLETGTDGKEIEKIHEVSLKGVTFGPAEEVSLPQTKSQKDKTSAELMGEPFAWKDLKIEIESKQKLFQP